MRALAMLAVLASASPAHAAARLSDERTYTRSAEALHAAPIHRAPRARAPAVGRLHLLTEDGYPEVYLLLRARGAWTRLRIPGRPNGRTGWVRSSDLAPSA